MSDTPTTVVFLARGLQHYRAPFHTLVRQRLAKRGITYRLLHSRVTADEALKGDLWAPDWAETIPITYFWRGLLWQWAWRATREANLLIVGQHSKHLHNYPLILFRRFRQQKLAFFGHGRGFQSGNPNGAAERFKRFWASKVDWWFAYTQSGADAVVVSGFPPMKITVFNNAIDTDAIAQILAGITDLERAAARATIVGGSPNVGVYVGGLYAQKRLAFLLDAATRIRAAVPDFHLLIIGGGPDAAMVAEAARANPWMHAVGPKFGRDKAMLVSLAKVMLMPGLVGLAALDAFAYGTPMVTTALPYHSPEFDYLADGDNAVVVGEADNAAAYAQAVAHLLADQPSLDRLRAGCAEAAARYSIEAMAERFVDGLMQALASR